MKMVPIYNNVGRLLGHIESKTYIDGYHDVTVCEDVNLVPFDPNARIIPDSTANIYRLPKKQIRFRNEWDEKTYTYLVIESALPEWFWKNRGCCEFKPEHFERIPH